MCLWYRFKLTPSEWSSSGKCSRLWSHFVARATFLMAQSSAHWPPRRPTCWSSGSAPLKEAKHRKGQFLPLEVVSKYELNPYSNERLPLKAHCEDGPPEVLPCVQGHGNERHRLWAWVRPGVWLRVLNGGHHPICLPFWTIWAVSHHSTKSSVQFVVQLNDCI